MRVIDRIKLEKQKKINGGFREIQKVGRIQINKPIKWFARKIRVRNIINGCQILEGSNVFSGAIRELKKTSWDWKQ